MGTLFRRGDRGGNWYAQYTDHTGSRTTPRSTGTSDKKTAQRILAKWEADAALRREGVIDAVAERLTKQSARSLKDHLGEFQVSLEAAGNTDKHIAATMAAINEAKANHDWIALSDITAESVEAFAGQMRTAKASNRTIQRKIAAIKQFTKWAHRTQRLSADPLIGVKTPNPETDRRIERRALHPDEWPYLRDATDPDRALLYELTIQTGLRQNEVRELTKGKLHLDQSPPFVLLPSRSTKNKTPARQYITLDLANRLRAYARERLPGSPLFDLPHESMVARMLRADLANARAAWIAEGRPKEQSKREKSDFLAATDHEGKQIDFHSLRHTCGAWLAIAGENPKTIQSIMRHSSITLTMDTYGHLFPAAESDAVFRLGKRHFSG